MYRVLALLSKRQSLSFEEFADHYENRHVPLVLGLPVRPDAYVRHYVKPGRAAESAGCDVVSQLDFQDRDAYKAWLSVMFAPDSGIVEDEDRFLDRSRTRSFPVQTES
ncbi:EthD domain-containing protein [Amycolatopsis saalfeldensis]|uniref:EthD domain-containing protein n=1 Tax=Amycolatopsis saalfeldensis TaxID=394193 RepID=A0A1H8XX60_9PSEU|nr:EthD domain-containing protein [Amycolatopsis saalfeldensis]SEP44640.1 EthD domain-containing protein [Amycolatopsis saalfeldensis]